MAIRIARETWALGALCLADLVYTVWLLVTGSALEANPVLQFYLGYGLSAFIGVKLLLSLGALTGIEWARARRPGLIEKMLQVAIALYVGAFLIGLWQVNRQPGDYMRMPVRASLRI